MDFTPNALSNLAIITAKGKDAMPYIQDFTKAMCQTQASSSAITVQDRRDGQNYTVRYINGNCWMTSDLRFTETTINPTTTNIDTTKTITWYDIKNNSACGNTALTTTNTTYACKGSGVSSSQGGDNAIAYNFAAASALTITGTSNSDTSTYDICPAGWKIPTVSEASGIVSYKSLFNPLYTGSYNNNTFSNTTTGLWWTTDGCSAQHRHALAYNRDGTGGLKVDANCQTGRQVGLAIRCVRAN